MTKSVLAYEMSESNTSHFSAESLKPFMGLPQHPSLCQNPAVSWTGAVSYLRSWNRDWAAKLQPILDEQKMRVGNESWML